MTVQTICGDSLEVLRTMADNSVDAIVTDPPYNLGFMGKGWDKTGIANNVELWREALRVLKPGGHLLAFSGSRTYHRMTCAIEDAGFEIRDQIQWIYGSGFPKSHNLGGEWQGWGTALKPAHEPICMARKPFTGTVAQNVLAHGTGAINIDGCRIAGESTRRQNSAEIGYHGGNLAESYAPGGDAGRWPANVIHDGSPEVVELFPAKAGALAPVKGSEPSVASAGNITNRRERVAAVHHGDAGSAARFFYCAKASKADRNAGCDGLPQKANADWPQSLDGDDKRGAAPRANHHPTVKPCDLMRYLCRLVTPPGGLVLDIFMGSGSTGKAAALEGFSFIGIDLSPEYVAIARARIADALGTREAA
ncbi:MAG: DNA-methyltransferase [Burkholderiaceae bacterium]